MHLIRLPLALLLASFACWAVGAGEGARQDGRCREPSGTLDVGPARQAGPTGAKGKIKLEPEEERALELVNQARTKAKLPALKVNALLTEVARKHSANMARQGKLEHKLDDKDLEARLDKAGYRWLGFGENIGISKRKGKAAGDEAFEAWMSSKGHRGNILETEFTETGLGVARNDRGEAYFTQVFAAPRP
ncbi:MAG: CAP domain-containing protein [Gemmataceae bacterium]|nr:CAP domain-containing protein [Gemmataceae bacterium]